MRPTAKELAHAVYRLGTGELVGDIPFDVWKRLTEIGMVKRGPRGEPQLTTGGESSFEQLKRTNMFQNSTSSESKLRREKTDLT